jgi:glyoxylase-like metal-dependent hydrolase (beta-lactamase superfamily II)
VTSTAATVAPGVRIHALQTGRVRVKEAHRTLVGPAPLRTAAIAADPRWTEWLPIHAWVVEHPEGVLVVDTGETNRVAEPGYFACDPGTRWVYEHLLRFDVPPETTLSPELARLGIARAAVRWVVLTHLHSDHAGGLTDVWPPRDHGEVLVTECEWEGRRRGALPCRWPAGFRPRLVHHAPEPAGAFTHSLPLTRDGRVRLVPTPGHSVGHQSVLVSGDGVTVCLAGDATFSDVQLRARRLAGICEDVGAAARTVAVLREQVAGAPTVYLPSHDADAARRLSALEPTRL